MRCEELHKISDFLYVVYTKLQFFSHSEIVLPDSFFPPKPKSHLNLIIHGSMCSFSDFLRENPDSVLLNEWQ